MGNYTAVTINEGQAVTSNSKPAGTHQQTNRGMLNDMQSTQPQNMRVTVGPNGMESERLEVTSTEAPRTSGLPGSLQTIQNSYGNPVGDMTAINMKTDSIQVGSSRCSIEIAIQQGLLSRDAGGNLVESESLKKINDKYLSHSSRTEAVDLVADHRGTLNQFHQRVGSAQTNAFVSQLASAVVNGKSTKAIIGDFAQAANATEESVHEWSQAYLNDLMDNGLDEVSRIGAIDREKLVKFVGSLPASTQARLLVAVHFGDPSAFNHLVKMYKHGIRG